jgi:demethylmenaquinone methyltransferase/2-methoxy-6-polyprenyl-1,4-benzoquinol methylase
MAETGKPTTHFGYRQVPVDEKVHHVRRVFETVAGRYDVMNDLMSLGTHRMFKRLTVAMCAVRPGQRILDLAAGTGDLAALFAPLVGAAGQVVVCDINRDMLELGRDRLLDRGLGGNLAYVQADAEDLPFPDGSFDCVTIGFGLRNVTRKEKALAAMARVARRGGRVTVLEFSRPEHPALDRAYDLYCKAWPPLGEWITGDRDSYSYLVESIRVHPAQPELRAMMADAGLADCRYHNLLGGVAAIHQGRKP